jgi:hypothetical protein
MVNQILEFIVNNPDKAAIIIAGLALILSFVSTILALWSVLLQRIHNRVSVRPIIDHYFTVADNHLCVAIKNNGLGPLIIVKFDVYKDNKIISNNLMDLLPLPTEQFHYKKNIPELINSVLSPDEELRIFEFDAEYYTKEYVEFRNKVWKILAPLSIQIHYKSIYKENQPIFKASLAIFDMDQPKFVAQ